MTKNRSLQPSDHPIVWHPCSGPYQPKAGSVVNITDRMGEIASQVWGAFDEWVEGDAYWSYPIRVKRNRKK